MRRTRLGRLRSALSATLLATGTFIGGVKIVLDVLGRGDLLITLSKSLPDALRFLVHPVCFAIFFVFCIASGLFLLWYFTRQKKTDYPLILGPRGEVLEETKLLVSRVAVVGLLAGVLLAIGLGLLLWQRPGQPAITEADEIAETPQAPLDTPAQSPPAFTPQAVQAQNSLQQTANANQNQSAKTDNPLSMEDRKHILLLENESTSSARLFATEKPFVPEGAPTNNWMKGMVTDPETGVGLKGATATIQNLQTADEYKAVSDNEGNFSLQLPSGEYKVTISYPGYQSESRQCTIRNEQVCYVRFKGLQKVLPPYRFNSIRILDSADHYAVIEVSYYYDGSLDKDDVLILLWLVHEDGSRFPGGWEMTPDSISQNGSAKLKNVHREMEEKTTQVEVCMQRRKSLTPFHCQRFPLVKTWKPYKPSSK
jgi:hypothetical protein